MRRKIESRLSRRKRVVRRVGFEGRNSRCLEGLVTGRFEVAIVAATEDTGRGGRRGIKQSHQVAVAVVGCR